MLKRNKKEPFVMTISAKSINFVGQNKTFSDMGLGSYWVRKDDQSGEIKTVKPWEEEVSNGDKFFPDPKENSKPHQSEQTG